APDLHVEVAAEGRVPFLDRGCPPAGAAGARDQGLQPGRVATRIGSRHRPFAFVGGNVHRHEIVTVVRLVSLATCFKLDERAPPGAMLKVATDEGAERP